MFRKCCYWAKEQMTNFGDIPDSGEILALDIKANGL